MISPLLAACGLACLVGAVLALRAIGPGYRIARLLAAAPEVSLAEAVAQASTGERRYVRTAGRISSDEEFPDEHDRPLVHRRTRLEVGDGRGGWRVVSDDREAVAFGIEARSEYLAVDGAALDTGLVVLPRESVGTAADLPADLVAGLPANLAAGLDPGSPARLVIRQVSAVEHAVVCGVPVTGPEGRPLITAGAGRPLILSTLDAPAAMRILAGGRRRLAVLSAGLLVASLAFLAVALAALVVGN
jgi:hypothetical protein